MGQAENAPQPKENQIKCLPVLEEGVKTARELATAMSLLMADLISGRVTPVVGNVICNAGGKLMKAVELQEKYGSSGEGGAGKTLRLIE